MDAGSFELFNSILALEGVIEEEKIPIDNLINKLCTGIFSINLGRVKKNKWHRSGGWLNCFMAMHGL